jgi:hypothetical protein
VAAAVGEGRDGGQEGGGQHAPDQYQYCSRCRHARTCLHTPASCLRKPRCCSCIPCRALPPPPLPTCLHLLQTQLQHALPCRLQCLLQKGCRLLLQAQC